MPYTTLVAGNPIQAAWANANVRDQVVTPFASAAARNAAITSPIEGMVAYLQDTNTLTLYHGSAWVTISTVAAAVATAEGRSGGYGNLTTPGPAVSIETGARALLTLSAKLQTAAAAGNFVYMAPAISGATTRAAGAPDEIFFPLPYSGSGHSVSGQIVVAGLTPGLNTFTMQYNSTSGTGTWSARVLSAVGLLT